MHMDHLGAELVNRGGDLLGIDAPAGQRPGGLQSSELGAGALQQTDRVAAPGEHLDEVRHRALLAAGRAVAVVEHQDAHCQLTLTDAGWHSVAGMCRNFTPLLAFTGAMHRRTIVVGIVVAAMSLAMTSSAAARPLADCQPFQARPCAFPFPSDLFTVADGATVTGLRVRLPGSVLPVSDEGVRLRTGPYDSSDGFSPGSTLIVHVPGLDDQQALQRTGAAGLSGHRTVDGI